MTSISRAAPPPLRHRACDSVVAGCSLCWSATAKEPRMEVAGGARLFLPGGQVRCVGDGTGGVRWSPPRHLVDRSVTACPGSRSRAGWKDPLSPSPPVSRRGLAWLGCCLSCAQGRGGEGQGQTGRRSCAGAFVGGWEADAYFQNFAFKASFLVKQQGGKSLSPSAH